jgi:KAP family P-loop domain
LATDKTLLLRDDPLSDLLKGDRFRHAAYQVALNTILRAVNPPFVVGLFGKWGTGKSTITAQLRSEYEKREDNASAFINLDVWKYQLDSFRRQFLLGVEAELVKQHLVSNPTIDSKLNKSETRPLPSRTGFKTDDFLALCVAFGIFGLIAVVLFFLFKAAGAGNPELSFLTLLLAPASVEAIRSVPQLIIQPGGTTTSGPPVTADQFEALFCDPILSSLKARKISKVVTVIDNLDRLQSQQVVEVLSSIKTFLDVPESPFLFVLPCDDEAIRRHIDTGYSQLAASQTPAAEFLRKFFNVTLSITSFYEEEMRAFAHQQLSSLTLVDLLDGEDSVNRLARMIAGAFSESPRQVNQFLNNLAARSILAQARIDEKILNLPGKKINLLLLAKMMIIEDRWPEDFKQICGRPSLLATWQEVVTSGSPGSVTPPPELIPFLLATEDVVATTGEVSAYLALKQTSDQAQLPDYDEFKSAAEAGDVSKIAPQIAPGVDFSATRARLLPRILEDAADRGDAGQSRNILTVIVRISNELQSKARRDLANEVGILVARYSTLRERLPSVHIAPLLDLVSASTVPYRLHSVIQILLNHVRAAPNDGEQSREIIEALGARHKLLWETELSMLRETLSGKFGSDAEALLRATSAEGASGSLLTPELAQSFAMSLSLERLRAKATGSDDRQAFAFAFEVIQRCDEVANTPSSLATVNALAELLRASTSEDVGIREAILELPDALSNTIRLGKESLPELWTSVQSLLISHPELAVSCVRCLITLSRYMDHQFVEQLKQYVTDYIDTHGPAEAETLIREQALRSREVFGVGFWLDSASRRLPSCADASSAQIDISTLLSTGQLLGSLGLAVERLASRIEQPLSPNWSIVVNSTAVVLGENRRIRWGAQDAPLVQPLVDAVLKAIKLSPDLASEAFPFLTLAYEKWPLSKETLRGTLTAFMETEDDPSRQALSLMIQRSLDIGLLDQSSCDLLIDAMLRYLSRSAPQTPNRLELLYTSLTLLVGVQPSKIEDAYRAIRSFSKPDGFRPSYVNPDLRPIAYSYIGRMGYLPQADIDHELGNLLDEARGATDPDLLDGILSALAALRQAKVGPRSRRWSEIRMYVGTLGDGYAEQLSRLH